VEVVSGSLVGGEEGKEGRGQLVRAGRPAASEESRVIQ
jgi:hypothetical protein